MKIKKWGIVNGGGDTPGMNTVIASIVKYGVRSGIEFYGFQKGWDGLLDNGYIKLDLHSVRGISHLGGTFLKTVNKGRFSAKIGSGQDNQISKKILEDAVSNYRRLDLDGIIVIGGDGTQSGGLQLMEYGVNIVGIPKTIDNDLPYVNKTFGFSTAVSIAAESMQRLQSTATSHDRVFLVELMGRNAGWITLYAGLAGGADAILLPEFDYNEEQFIEHLEKRKESGRLFSIVAVSEGLKISNELHGEFRKENGEFKLHGVSTEMEHILNEKYGDRFEFRNMVLGHLQRGGPPNAEDMILSKTYGISAVDAILDSDYGKIISVCENMVERIPITTIFGKTKFVTSSTKELHVAKKLGIFVNA